MIKKLLFSSLLFCLLSGFTTEIIAQNALNFDGIDDVVTTGSPGVSGSNSRTIEAWIKTTANSIPSAGGSQKTIVDWGTFINGQRFTFNLLHANAIRLEVGGNGLSGTIPVNDGNWHHVAVVYNASATNKVSLYVDGVLDASGNLTVSVNTVNSNPVRIGRRIDGVNGFEGSIDEVRVWNVARTQAQLQGSSTVELCAQANLIAYYKLNDGIAGAANSSVTSTSDFSGNNYSGTLSGFTLNGSSSNWVTGQSFTAPTFDSTVTNNNAGTLTASLSGATYQWIDCGNGNTPIFGATSQSFSPTAVGSYAVQVSQNGCSGTSACETVTVLGVNSNEFENQISVFPNPTNGRTTINLNNYFESISVRVVTLAGQTIATEKFNNSDNISVAIDGASGIYFMEISTNTGEQAILKLIKN